MGDGVKRRARRCPEQPVEVRATITLSDSVALPSLVAALAGSDCAVEAWAPESLDVVFDWGTPAEGELAHAWSEVVFFLTTWQEQHAGLTIDLEAVRFAPSSRAA
jgi:hypothetical protein